jgi:hypothetical protein
MPRHFPYNFLSYTVKKVIAFPVPSRDVTNKLSLGGNNFSYIFLSYTVKKVIAFPVPSRDVTNKLSLGGNNFIIPAQGEWLVTSRLGTGKSITFSYSVAH